MNTVRFAFKNIGRPVKLGIGWILLVLVITILSEAQGQQFQPTQIATPPGPTRIDLMQGTCPATATTGFDFTLCMEAGTLFQVSAAGTKSRVGGGTTTVSKAFQFLMPSPRVPFFTITGTPAPGNEIDVYRNGQYLVPGVGYTIAGNIVTPTVSVSGDRWTAKYFEALPPSASTFIVSPDGTRASFGNLELQAVNPAAVATIEARVFGNAPAFDVYGASLPKDVQVIGNGWTGCCVEIEAQFPRWDIPPFHPVSVVKLDHGVFTLP